MPIPISTFGETVDNPYIPLKSLPTELSCCTLTKNQLHRDSETHSCTSEVQDLVHCNNSLNMQSQVIADNPALSVGARYTCSDRPVFEFFVSLSDLAPVLANHTL